MYQTNYPSFNHLYCCIRHNITKRFIVAETLFLSEEIPLPLKPIIYSLIKFIYEIISDFYDDMTEKKKKK